MFCTNCRAEIGETDAFCPFCGTKCAPATPAAPTACVPPPDQVSAVANNIPAPTPAPQQAAPPPAPKPKRPVGLIILSVLLVFAVAVAGGVNIAQAVYSISLNSKIEAQATTISEQTNTIEQLQENVDSQKSTIAAKDSEIAELENTVLSQEYTIEDLENSLWFYEEYVVVIPDDGTERYHTYGCSYFDFDYFWAYNIDAAVNLGYVACPYCQ